MDLGVALSVDRIAPPNFTPLHFSVNLSTERVRERERERESERERMKKRNRGLKRIED